ncbi:hypothetical protein DMH17_03570 [Raoultella planticola]|nr:hypothetical protein [Raoultella planticola]
MSTYHVIDKESWHRRIISRFYRTFANPSFNLCVPVEAPRLYECAKDRPGLLFPAGALHAAAATNAVLSSSNECKATILLNMMILR